MLKCILLVLRAREGRRHGPAGPGAHGVAADAQAGAVHVVHGGQDRVGRRAAAGGVPDGVAVLVLGVVVVEEGKVGEVHEQAVADRAPHLLEGAGLDAAVVHLHGVVHVPPLLEAGLGEAVAVLVQRQDHHPPSGQLNGVGGVGLPIVLIPVEEQHAGGLVLRRGSFGGVELVGHLPEMMLAVHAPVGVDDALGDDHVPAIGLDGVGHRQRPEGHDQQR